MQQNLGHAASGSLNTEDKDAAGVLEWFLQQLPQGEPAGADQHGADQGAPQQQHQAHHVEHTIPTAQGVLGPGKQAWREPGMSLLMESACQACTGVAWLGQTATSWAYQQQPAVRLYDAVCACGE